ncbi:hypothetical protein GE061_016545 [Apolygus lucorum]|uniref:Uncharacterized protein n=1 Tax=Apolygus lucorum TaxID=248454 RepID=A0A8S9XKJ0_APOLU|nr:hypothetical protein GE061_016545 [Apolygus lucorum]
MPRTRSLQEGERIRTNFFSNNSTIWKFGVITKKLGQLHYIVELDNGRRVKRHIDQIQRSQVPDPQLMTPSEEQIEVQSNSGHYELDLVQHQTPERTECLHPNLVQYELDPRRYAERPENMCSNAPPRTLENSPETDTQPLPPQVRRSSRNRRPPCYLQDYVLH